MEVVVLITTSELFNCVVIHPEGVEPQKPLTPALASSSSPAAGVVREMLELSRQ